MPATIDAAALCKMAERGQITGGILDGPLAFDNAISKQAAKTKKIIPPVAGDPDILLAPDLEAGNILAKQLTFLANADSAGLVLGARVPIVLTSRADSCTLPDCQLCGCLLWWHTRAAKNKRGASVMDDYALVLNAGSSSLKFCVFVRPSGESWKLASRGQIDGIGTSPRISARIAQVSPCRRSTRYLDPDQRSALGALAGWLRSTYAGARVLGVGHRVVHGGSQYTGPTVITSRFSLICTPWSRLPRCISRTISPRFTQSSNGCRMCLR